MEIQFYNVVFLIVKFHFIDTFLTAAFWIKSLQSQQACKQGRVLILS